MDLLQCCKSALKYKRTKSAQWWRDIYREMERVKEWRVINAVQWIDVMFHFHICPASHPKCIKLNGFAWFAHCVCVCLCGQHCCLDKIYIVITENRRQQRQHHWMVMVMVTNTGWYWWSHKLLVIFFSTPVNTLFSFVRDGSNRKASTPGFWLCLIVCRAF